MQADAQDKGLWQSPYRFLFLSRFLKVLADHFAAISVVWLLIQMGGGAVSTSLLYVCSVVPQTMLAPLLSPLLSKGKLQQWMFVSDGLRAVLVLLVPLLYYFDRLPLWLFFVLMVLQSSTGAVYNPASVALLPRIVGKSRLQKANALLQSSTEAVTLIGLVGAGVFVTLLSAEATLYITSVLFVLSALVILLVRHEEQPDPEQDEGSSSYWQSIRSGFEYVRRDKTLYGLSLYALFLNVGLAPWTALSALFVAQELGESAAVLTLFRGMTAVGALVMGLVLTKITIKRYGLLFIAAGIVEGLAFATLGAAPWMWLMVACCFVLGVTMTAINVPVVLIIQTTVPERQQAQVFSVIYMIGVLLMPIFYLVSGVLAEWLGLRWVIALGGMVSVVSGLVAYYLTPLARGEQGEQKTGLSL